MKTGIIISLTIIYLFLRKQKLIGDIPIFSTIIDPVFNSKNLSAPLSYYQISEIEKTIEKTGYGYKVRSEMKKEKSNRI